MGWALEFQGDVGRALVWQKKRLRSWNRLGSRYIARGYCGPLGLVGGGTQSTESLRAGIGSIPIVLTLPATAAGAGPTALSILMELGITASWFACIIGSTTALSRILFAMGREGVAPEKVGGTHPRFHTPHVALLAGMPLIVLVPIVYLFVSGSSRDVLIGLIAVSAHGYVGAYLLVCLATPVFLHRIGELTRLPLVVGLTTALVMIAIIVWGALTLESPVWIATAVYGGLLAAGFAVFAIRARRVPDLADRVGVFDETVAGDVLAGYNPWEVRR
jgi:amino acid transporter